MSSAKTQVAVAPNVSTLAASQIQKDYSTEEPLNRQNSVGNNRRGNMKGKHLTRSHAMRESTSPPRTPTPRNDQQLASPNGQAANHNNQQQHHEPNDNSNSSHHNNNNNNNNSSNNNNNNNKLHAQSSAASPLLETPSVIVTSQHSQQQQQHQQQQQQKQNVVICSEADFPKLTPPKSSKSPRNNNHNNNHHQRDAGDKNSAAGDFVKVAEYVNVNGSVDNAKPPTAGKSNASVQSYSSSSGGGATAALQLALNISDGGVSGGGGGKQKPTAATSGNNLYNSSMNYQLKSDATPPQQQHHQQQQQHHQHHQQHSQQQQHVAAGGSNNMYDKENRCPRNDSQNSSILSHDENQSNVSDHQQQQQQQQHYERVGGNNGMGGTSGGSKKHRTTSNSKCTKPRLKNMGSSSSMDGGNSNSTSGFISRDSSMEQFTDQSGIDLLTFFKETLNKNPKDRNTLMKIEKDLIELAQEKSGNELRFPATSSYNRMLIHRTAAFFGMDHNVDTETQQCVIVATTKGTRIPEIRFKTLCRTTMSDEPRKSILKRDTHSFDDARQGSYLCPDRGMLDRKAKSFEEREEDYEKARRRIFRNQQQQQQQQHQQQMESGECDDNYLSWSSSVEQQQQQTRMRPNGKILKVQTSTESRDGRPVGMSKASSFGGYGVPPPGGGPPLMRGDSTKSTRVFAKQDSMGSASTPWRLSPSSSGYKTQTQSVHSESVTPSPTGYGSDEHTPEPSVISCQSPSPQPSPLPAVGVTGTVAANTAQLQPLLSGDETETGGVATSSSSGGLVWAVTDISSVPKGSVLINPHTLQPIVNQDGSIYHFDPSNLPPSQAITPGMYNTSGGAATHNNNYAQHPTAPAPPPMAAAPPAQPPPTIATSSTTSVVVAATTKKSKQQQQQLPHKNAQIEYIAPKCTMETCAESATQTIDDVVVDATLNLDVEEVSTSNREMLNIQEEATDVEEQCENETPPNCLSVTTTTSTKSYDRIEIQKFKNQATSPNIPVSAAEVEEVAPPVVNNGTLPRDQPSRSQYQSQTPTTAYVQQQRDTPNSARSTPYSNADSSTKRNSEEPKATQWTYTQSYQAPDGSTVFHTGANANPYCTTATTYQQGPDGSVYAIPQSMIYAYAPQMEPEVQGYFMPVFEPAQQQRHDTGGHLIPAGTQTLYASAGGGATVVPVAAATAAGYQTAQFATSSGGAPLYPGQVLYSSCDGTAMQPAAAAAAAASAANNAAAAAAAMQQYPVTTYPIGYQYPYNGYWGPTMTYYVPQQTALANAAPLLQAQPAGAAGSNGVALTNNLMVASAAAAGPSLSTAGSYQSSGAVGGYQPQGAARGKRNTPPHQSAGAGNSHSVIAAPGLTTTYQLGHAMPTFALASGANAAAAAGNDLAGNAPAGASAATAMYAIPQHATMFPANILPYAAAPPPATHHVHQHSAVNVAGAAQHSHTHPGSSGSSNTVISPLFSHPQQLFAQPAGGAHAPGPAAITIVDPAGVGGSLQQQQQQQTVVAAHNGGGAYMGNNTPQSAPSTPHALSTQQQRNAPLFATPPMSAASGVSYHYYAASNEASNYAGQSYVAAYDKRNNGAGKKSAYNNSNNVSTSYSTAHSRNSNSYGGGGANKPLIHDTRASPNAATAGISSNYQGTRPHAMPHKRANDKPSTPLLNAPSVSQYVSHNNNSGGVATAELVGKTSRINSAASGNGGGGGYRQKPSSFDFRRNGSQRNSPSAANSSSNDSNNNSPSSVVSSPPTPGSTYTTYVSSAGADQQQQQQQQQPLYIARTGNHIPPTPQHGAAGMAPPGTHANSPAAVLGAAAEAANAAAAAAAAVATGQHQPLLSSYNASTPTTGVYIKYGQTYFPTVALPNSRRSPQSDLRPPMAPMAGMYPAVNMMLSAPTRQVQPRHSNPNYKGNRPTR